MRLTNLRRFRVGLVMALVATLASAVLAVTGGSKVAGADPTNNRWDRISYNIAGLTSLTIQGRSHSASQYVTLIAQLRRLSGHPFTNNVGETTEQTRRIIEIDVNNNGTPVVAVYMWADTLYVFGFWTRAAGHRWFTDPRITAGAAPILGIREPRRLPWTGNYAQMPGGDPAVRAAVEYTGPRMFNDFIQLGNMRDMINGSNQARDEVGRTIVRIIGLLSEAARYQTIRNVVRNNLQYNQHTHLGNLNVELENSWIAVSRWIFYEANFENQRPFELVHTDPPHQNFSTVPALMNRLLFVQIRFQAGCGRNICN